MKNKRIGIFDSGYGGFSVLKKIIEVLPQYSYTYFGDNQFAPYGNKIKKIISERTKKALDFLFRNDCNLVILACNTASALSLKEIQSKWLPEYYPQKKVLGVLVPAIEEIINNNTINKICVIGTLATCNSKAYEREYAKRTQSKEIKKIFSYPTPRLVELVEQGESDENIIKVLNSYSKKILKLKPDAVVLGCTHYPLITKQIRSAFPSNIKIIDSAKNIGFSLKKYLDKHVDIKKEIKLNKQPFFYTTGDLHEFKTKINLFLNKKYCNNVFKAEV